ncbi:MAG: hypothetical protein HY873_01735 [Chloroflexi bacterium]|nr:hypothetical protein [Chloroflexota bacterium]
MYFTRFGYFVIASVLAAAAAAIIFIVWPFDGDSGSDGRTIAPTPTAPAAVSPTADPIPELAFDRVIDFATFGAVLSIEVTGGQMIVNLNPGFDVSGLNTTSHTFRTTLPAGLNSVEEGLRAGGIEVNGETGVPVIRR